MLRRFSIGIRIYLVLAVMVLFIAATVGAFLYNSQRIEMISLEQVNDRMLEGQKEKLQVATHSMAVALGRALVHVEGEEASKALIRDEVDDIRFEKDKSGYYFVYDQTKVITVPPKPSLQGKDLGDLKDKNGVRLVHELFKSAQGGGGFVTYIWPKPGAGDVLKLGYAEMIPGTNYWIGTGIYIDNIDAAKADVSRIIDDVVKSNTTIIVSILLAILVVGVLPLAFLIVKSITGPIAGATSAAEEIASGNYDLKLEAKGRDEAAKLELALNSMAQTLSRNIEEITVKTEMAEEKAQAAELATQEAEDALLKAKKAKAEGLLVAGQRLEGIVERVTAATEEISAQADEIRNGSDIQQERIQTTATAMEEMNATVLEVARNASDAAERGVEAKTKAQEGADVVGKSVSAMNATKEQTGVLNESMNELGRQAEAIGNIMSVITDIADQTNLLALNAAIEAARAGEAGRGFAVVADEVRKLAEKTMTATKEVGSSIEAIQRVASENITGMETAVQDLEQAATYTNQSGDVLKEIVVGTEESAEQIQSIATAAEEQSATSEEINRAIDEISGIVSETARGVSETTEALQELAEQASKLNQMVNELMEEGRSSE